MLTCFCLQPAHLVIVYFRVCVCVFAGQCGGLPSDGSSGREAYTCTGWECKTVLPWKPRTWEIGGNAVKTAHCTGVYHHSLLWRACASNVVVVLTLLCYWNDLWKHVRSVLLRVFSVVFVLQHQICSSLPSRSMLTHKAGTGKLAGNIESVVETHNKINTHRGSLDYQLITYAEIVLEFLGLILYLKMKGEVWANVFRYFVLWRYVCMYVE